MKSFNANFIIDEHFSEIVNVVDLHAEYLLVAESGQTREHDIVSIINQQRGELVEKINEIKDLNLRHFANTRSQKEFENEWAFLIEDTCVSDERKLETLQADLIKVDCFVGEDEHLTLQMYLFIVSWPINHQNLKRKNERILNVEYVKIHFILNQFNYRSIGSLIRDYRSYDFSSLTELNLVLAKDVEWKLANRAFSQMPNLKLLKINNTKCIETDSKTDRPFENNSNITRLHLSRHSKLCLNSRFFKGLHNLEALDINENDALILQSESFALLFNLKTLNLTSNKIDLMPFNLFKDLINLSELNLSKSLIGCNFPSESFNCLINLHHLSLAGNELVSLVKCMFSGLANLKSLNLSYNKIAVIVSPDSVFKDLAKLESLDLSFNALASLSLDGFASLDSLKSLHLDHNKLVSLAPFAFRNLVNLNVLSLKGNNLFGLEIDTFGGLERSLCELDLSSNELRALKRGSLSGFSNLKRLKIKDNKMGKGDFSNDIFQELTNLERSSIDNIIQELKRNDDIQEMIKLWR